MAVYFQVIAGDRTRGLKIEECALCKTHLLIIDGKTTSVFMEAEATANTLLQFWRK